MQYKLLLVVYFHTSYSVSKLSSMILMSGLWIGEKSRFDGVHYCRIGCTSYFRISRGVGYWELWGTYILLQAYDSCLVSIVPICWVGILGWRLSLSFFNIGLSSPSSSHMTLLCSGNITCSYSSSIQNFCQWFLGGYSSEPWPLGEDLKTVEETGLHAHLFIAPIFSIWIHKPANRILILNHHSMTYWWFFMYLW